MGSKQQRLEDLRAFLRLNKTQMAALLGIKQSYYSNIIAENGAGNLRLEHLEALLKAKSVNPLWLLEGHGDMFIRISDEMHWENEPTEEQIAQLEEYVLSENPTELGTRQGLMFKLACAQMIYENPDLKSLRDLAIGAKIYLRLIIKFPDINLAHLFDLQKEVRIQEQ